MADATFQIGVEALYDNTQLAAGTSASGTSLDQLATEAEAAANKIDASFAGVDTGVTTTFGPTGTFGQTPELVNTTGKKLKSAGKAVGADFASALTSGISSGDVAGTVSNLFSSLSLVGGVAAVGIGLGGALITGLVQGAQKQAEAKADALAASTASLLSKIEDNFAASIRGIEKSVREAATFDTIISNAAADPAAEGAAVAGSQAVTAAARDTLATYQDIVDLLEQGVNPSTRDTWQILNDQLDALNAARDIHGDLTDEQQAQFDIAARLLNAGKDQTQVIADTIEYQKHRNRLDEISVQRQEEAAAASKEQAAADREHNAALVDTIRNKKEVLSTIQDELENTDDLTGKEQDRLEARATLLEKQLAGLDADREAIALASQYAAQLERAASAAARIATNVLNGGKGGYF